MLRDHLRVTALSCLIAVTALPYLIAVPNQSLLCVQVRWTVLFSVYPVYLVVLYILVPEVVYGQD